MTKPIETMSKTELTQYYNSLGPKQPRKKFESRDEGLRRIRALVAEKGVDFGEEPMTETEYQAAEEEASPTIDEPAEAESAAQEVAEPESQEDESIPLVFGSDDADIELLPVRRRETKGLNPYHIDCRALLLEGKSDDEVWAILKERYNLLDDNRRARAQVGWNRWYLKNKGLETHG